jgi:predicted Zn-dependent peptidase
MHALARETASNAMLANQLAQMWDYLGDWRALFQTEDRLVAITPSEIREVARRYLRPDRRTVGWLLPQNGAAPIAAPADPPTTGAAQGPP